MSIFDIEHVIQGFVETTQSRKKKSFKDRHLM